MKLGNKSKISRKIYVKTKYETFSSESSGPQKFWILPKLYELCKSCHRNLLETLE